MLLEKIDLIKIIVMLILGGFIGWERERHGRPAGFRTHILVGIGSTLLMIVSTSMVAQYPDSNVDPGRIAAQVVSGIGFLGAGTIIMQGFSVKGLTTAASLWVTAAIGLAVGAGYYILSLITTVIVFVTLFFLSNLDFKIYRENKKKLICITEYAGEVVADITSLLTLNNININKVNIEKDQINKQLKIEFVLNVDRSKDIQKVNPGLLDIDGLKKISWENI